MSGKIVSEDEPARLSVDSAKEEWWPKKFDGLSVREQTAQVVHRLRYLTLKETPATHPLTLWLAADLDTSEGRHLIREALENLVITDDLIKISTFFMHTPIQYIFILTI